MAINRRDRLHLALHLTYAAQGGPRPWICRVLRLLGSLDCSTFRPKK